MRLATRLRVPLHTGSLAVALLLGACGERGLPTVHVVVSTGAVRHDVDVEVASTPAERARGLMGRTTLRAGSGMLFVFPAPTGGGFHMKDTLIPLTILFIRDGRVVEVRDMAPCTSDPCPRTVPALDYDSALEVPQGTLPDLTGGFVRVLGRLPKPS